MTIDFYLKLHEHVEKIVAADVSLLSGFKWVIAKPPDIPDFSGVPNLSGKARMSATLCRYNNRYAYCKEQSVSIQCIVIYFDKFVHYQGCLYDDIETFRYYDPESINKLTTRIRTMIGYSIKPTLLERAILWLMKSMKTLLRWQSSTV